MNLNISLNTADYEKRFNEQLAAAFESTVKSAISEFFIERKSYKDHVKPYKGPGLLEIEEIITKKFCSDQFQEKANKFFDDNWERIMLAAMEKAAEHKAKKIAFTKE